MNDQINRMRLCADKGHLSTWDLSIWFEVPYPSMWQWLHGRRGKKRGMYVRASDLEKRLIKLERIIKLHRGFKVPFEVSRGPGRSGFIRKIRDGRYARLPRLDTAAARVALRAGARR